MFCRLKFKNANITNKCDILKATFVGILTGSITSASQIDSNLFEVANSDIIEGSYGLCSWEVLYSDNYSTILHKESTLIPGKFKYLRLRTPDYPTNSHLYIETGDSFSTNTLTNLIAVSSYLKTETSVNRYAFISASNDFFVPANFGCEAGNFVISAFVEGFNWPYEQYSLEGRMKILFVNGVSGGINVINIEISNQYNAQDNSYRGPVIVGNRCIGLNYDINTQVGYTKEEDLTTNAYVLVPFVPRMLEFGWVGGNMSKVCGLYMGTSITISDPAVVTIGENTYQLIRPYPTSNNASATFYLKH